MDGYRHDSTSRYNEKRKKVITRDSRDYKNYQHSDDRRKRDRRSRSRSRSGRRDFHDNGKREFRSKRSATESDQKYEWGKKDFERHEDTSTSKCIEKEKLSFALSGALTEDTNKVNGVVIKYSEPVEARKPKRRWRLYPFKGETALPTLHIHRQSCFLIGRERKIVDLAVDHPSCSKQHAALQYRLVPFEREDGTQGKRVRPYIIDLDSANGTFLNNKKIEPRKYYELIEKDVIKFGFSTREYVILHENSKEEEQDDDVDIKIETES